MKLIRSIFEIRSARLPRPLDWRQQLFGVLSSGKELPPEAAEDGFKIKIEADKTILTFESTRLAIQEEAGRSEAEFRELIASYLNRSTTIVQWRDFDRIALRSTWIQPVDYSFEQLVDRFKKIYSESALVEQAKDVGLVLTLEEGLARINYAYGPFTRDQYGTGGSVYPSSFPDVFLVLDIDYILSERNELIVNKVVKPFLARANSYMSDMLTKTLELGV